MTNFRFLKWCRDAVSRIVLMQDRITVEQELMGHMEDRYDSLTRQGHSSETAEMLTLASMGNPEEVARELGLIHRPFWGHVVQTTHYLVIGMLCLTLLFGGLSFLKNFYFRPAFSNPSYGAYNPYTDTNASLYAGQAHRTFYSSPDCSFSEGGYTVKLTHAALWNSTVQNTVGKAEESDSLYMQLQVTNPLIWADADDISRWLWAEDDLGNRYDATYESAPNTESVRVKTYRVNPWSTVHELILNNFISRDAQWIDLHYDRAGRDYTLRVELTGGS